MSPVERALRNFLIETKLADLTWSFPQHYYINCTEEEARNDPFMKRVYLI